MRTNKRVCAVIVKDRKVLLIHRIKNGREYWVVPGGGVESDENIEKALKREVYEETGLNLVNFSFIESNVDQERENYFYMCVVDGGKLSLGGPEKIANCNENSYVLEWVLIKKVESLDVYPKIIKKLL